MAGLCEKTQIFFLCKLYKRFSYTICGHSVVVEQVMVYNQVSISIELMLGMNAAP
jgi:hypothetical protein